ncbi:MAG TPA: MBL fold metallo-hydrolase [Thermomicrobiales bacterium]|nr:MBL fold metallo-hydrolase [Thermomicrobiales bacterium]
MNAVEPAASSGLIVQFLGSGDAIGSGGRLPTSISVRASAGHVLLDCGPAAVPAMIRHGVDPGTVDAVVLTHLHGDHFAGIPFLVLHAQFRRRERPLLIAGPVGVEDRVLQTMELLFPGSVQAQRRFELRFSEHAAGLPATVGPAEVTAFEVVHPSGAPAYALRLRVGSRILAYTGDGAWSENVVDVARGADLLIAEAYTFDKPIKFHLDYATLERNWPRLECRRLILTHMSDDMLARRHEAMAEPADDGLLLSL